MNTRPLVSILVPVFNHQNYIEECLCSFLIQSYKNFEILICDDGSKDNSVEVIKGWMSQHPEISCKLFIQENQGVCKTLNRLIGESSGEYIAFCASDDSFTPNSLSERIKYLIVNSSKMACIGDANLIDQSSKKVSTSAMKHLYNASYKNLSCNIVKELVLRWSVVGPTLMIRKNAFIEFGLYDESLIVEDRDYYLRLLANDTLLFLPSNVANYRIHTDNATRRDSDSKMKILKDVAYSNLRHNEFFSGINRLFLKSHAIDLFIINRLSNVSHRTRYALLFVIRLVRKMMVRMVL